MDICKCFCNITYKKSYINVVNVTHSWDINKQCDFSMEVYTTYQKNTCFSLFLKIIR